MMEKIRYFCIICSILLCLFPVKTIKAEEPATSIYQNSDTIFDEEEYEEILQAISKDPMMKISGITARRSQCGDSYKEYILRNQDFVSEMKAGIPLSELISSEYTWKVPMAGMEIKVGKENDVWKVYGCAMPRTEDVVMPEEIVVESDLVQMDVLERILSEFLQEGNVLATDIRCFTAPWYFANFVYFATEEEEYLIPFCCRPDLTGLKNGTLYTASEVCQALENKMSAFEESGESNGNSNGNSGSYGNPVGLDMDGGFMEKQNNSGHWFSGVTIIVGLMFLFGIIVMIAQKN